MIIMKILLPEGKSLQYIYYIRWIFFLIKTQKYVGPWDSSLQCSHLDKHPLGQQNTKKLPKGPKITACTAGASYEQ